jgi:carbon storage regulator
MLVLSRKLGDSLVIGGNITIKVLQVRGNTIRLGIEAPLEVSVYRHEVLERLQGERSDVRAELVQPCAA